MLPCGKLRTPEAKHWQMQKDGDVRCAIWRVITAKGPGAIKVAKAKGHATANDIEEGRATAATKAGNDVADGLVGEATALHGKGTVDFAYWLEARHKAYCSFMADIQQMIIRMLTLDKEERDRRKREANPFDRIVIPTILVPISIPYLSEVGQRRLGIKDLPTCMHRFSAHQRALIFVHRFMRMVFIRPTSDGEPGVTWLELLIAFELHGGKLEEAIHERATVNMAHPAMTTRQLLVFVQSSCPFYP